jgi:hypothetical protein
MRYIITFPFHFQKEFTFEMYLIMLYQPLTKAERKIRILIHLPTIAKKSLFVPVIILCKSRLCY